MATTIANMSMSLDGFIADPADGTDRLFGGTPIRTRRAPHSFKTSAKT